MTHLPKLALSVRQPWAWAIIAGHKTIENRTAGSIRAGRMAKGSVCIHAAVGLKQDEFRWAHWRLQEHGVQCPHPSTLIRGAIIGTVDVVDIISTSDSAWFGGPMGLVLDNAVSIDPIPAKGALGYFEWQAADEPAPPSAWMKRYDPLSSQNDQGSLFDGLPVDFKEKPKRPTR